MLHYIHEIFKSKDLHSHEGATTSIWDFLTEHARRKFQLTIERDVLSQVHLLALLANLLDKLNIKLTRPLETVDFASNDGSFLQVEDIQTIGPSAKDYEDESVQLLS